MRILIAEDDEALGKFVRQGLEGEQYAVDVFKDGEQARSAATESEYDLVILDLNLPKLDGVSVLVKLQSAPLNARSLSKERFIIRVPQDHLPSSSLAILESTSRRTRVMGTQHLVGNELKQEVAPIHVIWDWSAPSHTNPAQSCEHLPEPSAETSFLLHRQTHVQVVTAASPHSPRKWGLK